MEQYLRMTHNRSIWRQTRNLKQKWGQFVVLENICWYAFEKQRKPLWSGAYRWLESSAYLWGVIIMPFVLKCRIRVQKRFSKCHVAWSRLSGPQTSFSYGFNRRNYPPSGKLDLNWNGDRWSKKKRLNVECIWMWNASDRGMLRPITRGGEKMVRDMSLISFCIF